MLMVGVEPELLEPPLVLVLALEPPPPLLELLLFELEPPHAASANAVIATSSSAASGRTNLFKLVLLQEGLISERGSVFASEHGCHPPCAIPNDSATGL
jgi:hypothetical protein